MREETRRPLSDYCPPPTTEELAELIRTNWVYMKPDVREKTAQMHSEAFPLAGVKMDDPYEEPPPPTEEDLILEKVLEWAEDPNWSYYGEGEPHDSSYQADA